MARAVGLKAVSGSARTGRRAARSGAAPLAIAENTSCFMPQRTILFSQMQYVFQPTTRNAVRAARRRAENMAKRRKLKAESLQPTGETENGKFVKWRPYTNMSKAKGQRDLGSWPLPGRALYMREGGGHGRGASLSGLSICRAESAPLLSNRIPASYVRKRSLRLRRAGQRALGKRGQGARIFPWAEPHKLCATTKQEASSLCLNRGSGEL